MKKVIYTAITGKYDNLQEPEYIPKGYDFICFTDHKINKPNSIWNIKYILPLYDDNTRVARKYKILPHRFLSEYDLSIWIDGNFIIKNDIHNFIEKCLSNHNMACFDHISCYDKRNCAYQEANAIFSLGREKGKTFKDNPYIIKSQMERYISEKYPPESGLISSGVLIRKHNKSDVIKVMEDWWLELKYGSKRDQLSFNYTAWKNSFNFLYINKDIRNNEYFQMKKHNK